MGVQDVVARLHKQTSRKKSNIPPLPNKKQVIDNKQLPPSPIPSPTMTSNDDSITSLLQKFEQPPMLTKLPTPPESPNKLNVTHRPRYSLLNKTVNEIEDLFQNLIDQNNAAEEYILHLQSQVEKYAADATKVKDYEIRVEYLNTKLEQVTEERDFYETQLNQELAKPAPQEQDMKSVQMAMMQYLTDLEKQKLETKGLKQVVKKQDELISKLEEKLEYTSEELLKEQVQVQSIELDNKRELLAQLLNEREELIHRLNQYNPRNSFRKISLESLKTTPPPLTAPPKHPLPPL